MAKTISESILSIETTETSLESSLSKCKTSISNKGVSVPSATRFSNLPALIDKIDTETYDFAVTFPQGDSIKSLLRFSRYEDGVEAESGFIKAGETKKLAISKPGANNEIRYRWNFADQDANLRADVGSGLILNPVYYVVFADDMDKIVKIYLTNFNKDEKLGDFVNKNYYCYFQYFGSDGHYLRMGYKADSGDKTVNLKIRPCTYPHVHIVYIKFARNSYTEHILTSNDFTNVLTDIKF